MRRLLIGVALLAGLFGIAIVSALLTVNLGSRGEEVLLPDLTGMQLVPAIETLEELGLSLKINGKEYSDTLAEGTIISHLPGVGSMVRKGRSVEAVVSVGPRRVAVPDLRGDFVLRAQSILLQNNLTVGKVVRLSSRRWSRDTVIGQSPAPPAFVRRGTPLDLLVSVGPPPVLYVMPDFIGTSLSDVVRRVQEAGLELGQVAYGEYPGVPAGTVVDQKPALGMPVGPGEPIEVTVVRGAGAADRKPTRYSTLSFYVPEGLRPRQVRVLLESDGQTRTALDESRPPGDRVQILVEADGKTKALIFVDDQLQDTRFF